MHRWINSIFLSLSITLLFSAHGMAQEAGGSGGGEGEGNFDQILNNSLASPEFQEKEQKQEQVTEEELTKIKLPEQMTDLSSLGLLAPFEDVAVIQKRFLPKTKRFEAFPGVGVVVNDAFFQSMAMGIRFGYYFSEMWGLEAVGSFYSTTERQVTTDLKEKYRISTKAFVTPKSYMGLDLKWSPIFGKVGSLNKNIIPFDMYFALGAGIVSTSQDTSPMGVHLGWGQIFALSKSMAFRWDLSWYWYNSETKATGKTETTSAMNLVGTLGVSFFFPEASYR